MNEDDRQDHCPTCAEFHPEGECPLAPRRTRVVIPGTVAAIYSEGIITEITFTPHASGAGYFGPSAIVEEFEDDLNVEDVDGPFWRAVQNYLAEHPNESIGWTE